MRFFAPPSLSFSFSPLSLPLIPPVFIGVTRCKGPCCGSGFHSNRPSTYPSLGSPTRHGNQTLVPRPFASPATPRRSSRSANINSNLEPRVLRLLGQRWVPGDSPLTEEPENSGLEIGSIVDVENKKIFITILTALSRFNCFLIITIQSQYR